MKHLPPFCRPAPFREPPDDLLIFSRSVSDDDLCAWCRHLFYSPGGESVCRYHGNGGWPGRRDRDGYYQDCMKFLPSTDNDAP